MNIINFLFILFAAGILVLSGCSSQKETGSMTDSADNNDKTVAQGQILVDDEPVQEDSDFDINTDEMESDLNLSGLDDIEDELEDINW